MLILINIFNLELKKLSLRLLTKVTQLICESAVIYSESESRVLSILPWLYRLSGTMNCTFWPVYYRKDENRLGLKD